VDPGEGPVLADDPVVHRERCATRGRPLRRLEGGLTVVGVHDRGPKLRVLETFLHGIAEDLFIPRAEIGGDRGDANPILDVDRRRQLFHQCLELL
jgi:hypothetical protein